MGGRKEIAARFSAFLHLHQRKMLYRGVGLRVFLLAELYKLLPLPRFTVRIRNAAARYPLWCRLGSSDISVFTQIFCEREYACFDHLPDPSLIIDCGANVGYSAAYFLTRFPQAFIVAVEPFADNFAILQKNLAPYGERFSAIHAGVWPSDSPLKIANERLGDGLEWGVTVRPCRPGEQMDIPGINIGDILARTPYPRISILKIDIEGSESEVFAAHYESWLPQVDNIAIELHSADADRIFKQAIASEHFDLTQSGELTVGYREQPEVT